MKQLLVLCLFLLGLTAYAGRIEYGSNITINSPVYEDLYIAGGTVVINAPVHGDLIAAGGTIQINDTVMNDILVTGGNINFHGYVGDDIRCAGGTLMIYKDVGGDVVVTGGNVIVNRSATIGSLVASGGDIRVDGNIRHELRGIFGRLTFNGSVNNATCRGGHIIMNGVVNGPAILAASEKLVIGNKAVFRSTVNYWSPAKKVDFGNAVTGAAPVFDKSLKIGSDHWYFLGFTSFIAVLWYLAMALVMIFLVTYFFPNTMYKAGMTLAASFWKSLGYGLLFFIAVPVLAIIICVTVIGLPVGLITMAGYLVLLLLAGVITAVVLSNWIHQQTGSKPGLWRLVFSGMGIFIVLKIVSLTPFLGWLVMLLIVCAAFGAVLLNINWKINRQRFNMPAAA